MAQEWVVSIRNVCVRSGIPFFFKQWGGINKKKAGRHLEGRLWEEMPERIRAQNLRKTRVG
jgi:protein gp37